MLLLSKPKQPAIMHLGFRPAEGGKGGGLGSAQIKTWVLQDMAKDAEVFKYWDGLDSKDTQLRRMLWRSDMQLVCTKQHLAAYEDPGGLPITPHTTSKRKDLETGFVSHECAITLFWRSARSSSSFLFSPI